MPNIWRSQKSHRKAAPNHKSFSSVLPPRPLGCPTVSSNMSGSLVQLLQSISPQNRLHQIKQKHEKHRHPTTESSISTQRQPTQAAAREMSNMSTLDGGFLRISWTVSHGPTATRRARARCPAPRPGGVDSKETTH